MKFKHILLVYKRSAYQIYFGSKKRPLGLKRNHILTYEKKRFKAAHDEHYATLKEVTKILLQNGVRYTEARRGQNINYSKYDLIFTVGGDGTFLEAAKNVKKQVMVGINSAPNHSVGRFCVATKDNFESLLGRILNGTFHYHIYQRLRVKFKGNVTPVDALNDILVSHYNPAVLCRYILKIGRKREEQRSSGIWISTPAGSTGAIHSAGGVVMSPFAKKFQYMPRELYSGLNGKYKLKGGVLSSRQKLTITGLMRKGMLFVDGAHQKFPFDYGTTIKVGLSPDPITTIKKT